MKDQKSGGHIHRRKIRDLWSEVDDILSWCLSFLDQIEHTEQICFPIGHL